MFTKWKVTDTRFPNKHIVSMRGEIICWVQKNPEQEAIANHIVEMHNKWGAMQTRINKLKRHLVLVKNESNGYGKELLESLDARSKQREAYQAMYEALEDMLKFWVEAYPYNQGERKKKAEEALSKARR